MEDTNIHHEFQQFDVVSDESDHYYRSSSSASTKSNDSDCFTNSQSHVHRRIMKEWRILQAGLPDSIFVRAFETRIDLLRAAVVGATGTPYHDGLFFFDIAFPPNYPSQPPMVHYRSFGYHLNPSLYATGHVCLSLLNTWFGKSCERWIPTVLQILLSLQSLVLSENPYLNEAFMPRTAWSRKRSIEYDGTVFVLTCYSTLQLIRKPPINFESLVRWHFLRRANAILMACEQYANGRARVGFYESDPAATATVKVLKKLQRAIAAVYPVMVVAFRAIGANLLADIEVLRLEETKKKKKEEKEKSEVVLKKTIMKIREILGFKSKKR